MKIIGSKATQAVLQHKLPSRSPYFFPLNQVFDRTPPPPYTGGMEVHFNPDLQAKVNRIAADNRSDADEYVQQLVERYVDHDAWFREQVKKGLDQLDRGEFLDA